MTNTIFGEFYKITKIYSYHNSNYNADLRLLHKINKNLNKYVLSNNTKYTHTATHASMCL